MIAPTPDTPPQSPTLYSYLESVFIPDRFTPDTAAATICNYRTAVRRLDFFAKREARLGEIGEAMLAEFYRWLVEHEASEERAQFQCDRIVTSVSAAG